LKQNTKLADLNNTTKMLSCIGDCFTPCTAHEYLAVKIIICSTSPTSFKHCRTGCFKDINENQRPKSQALSTSRQMRLLVIKHTLLLQGNKNTFWGLLHLSMTKISNCDQGYYRCSLL